MALLGPLLAIRLLGDQESGGNLEAARALCGRIGDSAASSAVLSGLVTMYFQMGELRSASEVVSELRSMLERNPDELLAFRAHSSAGLIDTWMGRFRSARKELKAGLEINHDLIIGTADEPRLYLGWSHLVWVLWTLGYSDQVLRAEARLVGFLSRPVDLFSRASILQSVLPTHCHFLRDYRGMRQQAESLIALCREHGLQLLGMGLVRFGRIEVEEGSVGEGIETMLEGMRALRETGQVLPYDYFCCVLAEGYLAAGRAEEGISVLDEAIASSAAREQRFFEAEMYRLEGELLLLSGARDDAEKSIREAVAIARRQEAKSWELRATTSLARLLRDTNRRDEARAMLAGIYNWFTEGFDTPDLKDAKALLDQLSN